MSTVADEPKIIRIRQGVLVICPECGNRCFANRTEDSFTRYYCSNASCDYSTKISKPKLPDGRDGQ